MKIWSYTFLVSSELVRIIPSGLIRMYNWYNDLQDFIYKIKILRKNHRKQVFVN